MKTIGLILCLLCAASVHAQDYEKLAQLTCDCISKKDPSKIDPSMLQTELGLCLLEVANKNGVQIDLSDPTAMQSLGEQIGIKMAGLCLEKMLAFTAGGSSDSDSEQDLEGTVKSVEVGDFVFIVVKEPSGRESKLLWLRYFEGSDAFVENPKSLSGKEVAITYVEIECFVPKAGAYFKQKEITSLQVK